MEGSLEHVVPWAPSGSKQQYSRRLARGSSKDMGSLLGQLLRRLAEGQLEGAAQIYEYVSQDHCRLPMEPVALATVLRRQA